MANILSVDDSAAMRQIVAVSLEAAGHKVTQAWNGEEALIAAQKQKFELVLTDVNMPKMDGLELTRQLRKLESYKFTPILVLTTESAGDKKQEGKAAGATGWLVKPFDPEQLIRTVGKVLG
jgi:two-component system chemotaxis response regulator CheY